jgi:hypothetical protein
MVLAPAVVADAFRSDTTQIILSGLSLLTVALAPHAAVPAQFTPKLTISLSGNCS